MTANGVKVGGRDVSRETFEALRALEALVVRWNPAINLVSKSSLATLWNRHILDSAQLFEFLPSDARHWVDLGSGAGFPGLVVAILARDSQADLRVTLVEADSRKATFLREASRMLGLSVAVVNERFETIPSLNADVLSARAVAPLTDLIEIAVLHLLTSGLAIFPKGARHAEEVTEARINWTFDCDSHDSRTEPGAAVLAIRNIERA